MHQLLEISFISYNLAVLVLVIISQLMSQLILQIPMILFSYTKTNTVSELVIIMHTRIYY